MTEVILSSIISSPPRRIAASVLLSLWTLAFFFPQGIFAAIDTQEAQLTASDGAAGDRFGLSVALSQDGNTAIVGAFTDDVGANDSQGSAYIYTRSGGNWSQEAQLTASDGAAGDQFGVGVAISEDGNTVLVGANGDDVGANSNQGSAYVFTRSGTTWTEQQHLTASDGAASDQFGASAALSMDGNTAIVGANFDDVGANADQGSAYAFTRSGSTWSEQQQLTATGGAAGDRFGDSVSLSDDGNTALVGSSTDDVGANSNQGSAYAFTRSGSTWSQEAQLTATGGAASNLFGNRVNLAADGNTAIIAAPSSNSNKGSAYVFTRSGTTWSQEAQLTASDGASSDSFGSGVNLTDDGNTAIVGASGDDVGAITDQGSAYVFTRSGSTWSEQQQLTASDGAASDRFGQSAALSADASTAIVGADGDDVGAITDQGSAYVFIDLAAFPASTTSSDSSSDDGGTGSPSYTVSLRGGTLVRVRRSPTLVRLERQITVRGGVPITLTVLPSEPGLVRNVTLRIAGTTHTLKTPIDSQSRYHLTLPALSPGTYPFVVRARYDPTTATEYGTVTVVGEPGKVTPDLLPHVNMLFRLVFLRSPTFAEWAVWAARVTNGDKTTLPSLLGAMEWLRAERGR